MIVIFAAWLTIESIHPNLHIDQFFYEIVERRIKDHAFYRLILVFLSIETALMALTVLLGGFLASITPFVGEQNQNKTKFTFASLLMDLPLGLSTISSIQAIIWCIIKYIDHFRRPSQASIQNMQERMMMVNKRMNSSLKNNRRVTFKTASDSSNSSSRRCSDVSRTSSTVPILTPSGEEEENQGISRAASSSSSSTLLPTYLNQTQTTLPKSGTVTDSACKTVTSAPLAPKSTGLQSEVAAPLPVLSESRIRPFMHHFKPEGTSTMPPIGGALISKPSPAAASAASPNSRFPTGSFSRYPWLRNQSKPARDETPVGKPSPFTTTLPYSRVGRLGKISNLTGRGPYQRVALQNSSNPHITSQCSISSTEFRSLENESSNESLENSTENQAFDQFNARRKPVPAAAVIEIGDEPEETRLKDAKYYTEDEGGDSDDISDDWAETKSQLTVDRN
ncbi:hypothetical protein PPACK8108_LOCUS10855 [Phakopsora pachyrhizi]|uniref:Uncharacterized protein n=1 Tax=Phakopsora pachyrhizi TaxID=170000 RepID=A0AAV0AMS3_PHAPC|nr:hypothetical protein PPACK8108_LOCUS4851 [Phakopsora pachyrhizi]CAH7675797.1 hypothetical protein PPACK8108_LOCUS10855 [Phakopsora pachyrhizi]